MRVYLFRLMNSQLYSKTTEKSEIKPSQGTLFFKALWFVPHFLLGIAYQYAMWFSTMTDIMVIQIASHAGGAPDAGIAIAASAILYVFVNASYLIFQFYKTVELVVESYSKKKHLSSVDIDAQLIRSNQLNLSNVLYKRLTRE